MGKITLALMLLWLCIGRLSTAPAASIYLSLPGISGDDATPGFPDAIAVSSLTISPNQLTVVKRVDKASPQIVTDVALGTLLSDSNVLLYNAPPTSAPDATIAFPKMIADSYLVLGGSPPTEQVGFSSTTPESMYLDIPGITGASSTPGYPGVIAIQSLSLEGDEFSVTKQLDKTSPQFSTDLALGTLIPDATVLLYDSSPSGPPDATLLFQKVLVSADTITGAGDSPAEQVTFQYVSVTQPVPEPTVATMVVAGLGVLVLGNRRRGRRSRLSAQAAAI